MDRSSKCCGTQFKFSQVFGYKSTNDKIQEEDIISVMRFDGSGKYLALGDHAGRVIVFSTPDTNSKKKFENYEYAAQFQAHVREFDALRSQEVQEGVNSINWLRNQGKFLKIITSNTKDIKIWKLAEKIEKKVTKCAGKQLSMPKIQNLGTSLGTSLQKVLPSHHSTPINAVSFCQSQEYLLSSDDIQMFLRSIQKPQKPYMPVDLKGGNKSMQDTTQTITCSKFHPISDSLFIFGTNKGSLRLGDMRAKGKFLTNLAICDNAVDFKYESSTAKKNFLNDMVSSYSSASFLNNSRYIVSRDYLTVKIWDVANSKKPLSSITVQESIKSKLCQIFQNDCLLDKFNLCSSPDSNTIMTGNYNNNFHLMNVGDQSNTQYQLSYKKQTVSKNIVPNKIIPISKMDYVKKSLATDFHPNKNLVAVASLNCFFLYSM